MFEGMTQRERLEWLILDDQRMLAEAQGCKDRHRDAYIARLKGEPIDHSPGTDTEWFRDAFIRWDIQHRDCYAEMIRRRAELEALA